MGKNIYVACCYSLSIAHTLSHHFDIFTLCIVSSHVCMYVCMYAASGYICIHKH